MFRSRNRPFDGNRSHMESPSPAARTGSSASRQSRRSMGNPAGLPRSLPGGKRREEERKNQKCLWGWRVFPWNGIPGVFRPEDPQILQIHPLNPPEILQSCFSPFAEEFQEFCGIFGGDFDLRMLFRYRIPLSDFNIGFCDYILILNINSAF